MNETKSAEKAVSLMLAEAQRTGTSWARWGMVRRDLTRWQRLRTLVRGWLGLAPLPCDEEWVLSPKLVASDKVIRFRRHQDLGGPR